MSPSLFQVLLNDSPVSSLKVLLTVLTPKQVERNTNYLITKLGGNVTLDCTDFEGEDVHWKRLGGKKLLNFSI
jgi:hypothetical protein